MNISLSVPFLHVADKFLNLARINYIEVTTHPTKGLTVSIFFSGEQSGVPDINLFGLEAEFFMAHLKEICE